MSKLFETTQINGMSLSNRFVRSATWEGMATDDGECTPKLTALMTNLAKGGVGLIITSHAYVRQDGQAGSWQLGIYKDELVPALQAMTKAVHAEGGKIVLQISHAGFFARTKEAGETQLAPSAKTSASETLRREMTLRDIQEITEAFGQAAIRAKKAGFDGVQIHSAHGYLLSQFLSPVYNLRTDEYGGDIKNRARALLNILQVVRDAVGKDYPVLVKMNCQDFVENGLNLEDAVQVGMMLSENGIDAIELSGGILNSRKLGPSRMGIKSAEDEAYFREEAKAFKEKIRVPLILVGGMRSCHVAERLVEQDIADYISMCRPFIREPELINRWKAGDLRAATCLSDNLCFEPGRAGEGILCETERRLNKKQI